MSDDGLLEWLFGVVNTVRDCEHTAEVIVSWVFSWVYFSFSLKRQLHVMRPCFHRGEGSLDFFLM
jgi:hypothetical protein